MNIYWPVYKNLESQFLKLMFDIHIDDNQLDVYSLKISDLILRAAIEIESISKDLYLVNGGVKTTQIKYDEDALKHLNRLWALDKKVIIISSTNCFLTKKLIYPFVKNEIRTGSQRETYSWNNSYQNIKHDRANSLQFASVKYLFQIMSALYLLNIYFKNETFHFGRDHHSTTFPVNLGSDIFSISFHKWFMTDEKGVNGKKDNFDECIYFSRMTNESVEKIRIENEEINRKFAGLLYNHPKFKQYSTENDISNYNGDNIACDILGEDDYIKLLNQSRVNQMSAHKNIEYEAVLNKSNKENA